MTLSIDLSAQAEVKLKEQAAALGKDPASYASQILEQAIIRPSLQELLAPLRQQFIDSGNTDEALVTQITEARDVHRSRH